MAYQRAILRSTTRVSDHVGWRVIPGSQWTRPPSRNRRSAAEM